MMTRTPVPIRRSVGTVGLWLFLAALVMLFGSSMVAYVLIRLGGPENLSGQHGSVHVPSLLWLSTVLVIAVSFAIHRAQSMLRIERHDPFRFWLRAALIFAIGFITVQTPAMIMLLHEHARYKDQHLHIYGLIFFLVLLHALHVVGGVVALVRLMIMEGKGVFDHEHYLPVHHAALYWHFLDVVWLVMFGTFLLVG